MKLEVGEYYLNTRGESVKIDGKVSEMFLDSSGNSYYENGKVRKRDKVSVFDLIAHIPKELHKHILNEINSYYTDKDFKETVKSVWGDK